MNLAGDWLQHPGTTALFQALTDAGYQVLYVGGCVRNALMRLPVGDIDLASDAPPDVVSDLCTKAGLKVVPTGIDHGTVTVIAKGRPHEVTTFRQDVATDGRHAEVAFGTDIAVDAARRDFTMNALYARADGTVVDPLGGLADVIARRVRFVGDPAARIAEDYLRILRFFRFHAVYGEASHGIDADGLAACAANSAGTETLSRERIGHEMRKLLAAADPAPAIAAMMQAGVLGRILPGADPRALAPLVHLELDADPDWLRRLAALGGEDAENRLRLSRVEARDLADLRKAIGTMETPAVLGWRLGANRASDAMLLRAVVLETPLPAGWPKEVTRGAAATFPISAADLMPALTGAPLGERLKALEARWLASNLRHSREDLLKS
jgi:poly(A) polymerase